MSNDNHPSKARLLEAAVNVIRARGYTATRIEDVCLAAGLTKGSFFHHFPDKEALAVEAARSFGDMAERRFSQAPFAAIDDPLERLLGYIDFRIALLQGSIPQFTCLLGTMVQEVYGTHPAVNAACEVEISAHAAKVAADIALAREYYMPDAEWTAESLGLFTQAVIQGSFILAKAKGGPESAISSLRHLKRYIELLFQVPQKEEESHAA